MEEDKIVYGNCWVAYFDMLGFSNRIKSQLPLESTLNIYDEIIGKIKNINRYCEDIKIAWFPDTFLFYAKDDSRDSFINLRNFTTAFFRGMFLKGIPMRGCVHCGNFYAEKERRIYFGEGLIVAYKQAEDQQMIGFTMTQEAKVKLTEYPTDNPEKLNENVWEHCEKYE